MVNTFEVLQHMPYFIDILTKTQLPNAVPFRTVPSPNEGLGDVRHALYRVEDANGSKVVACVDIGTWRLRAVCINDHHILSGLTGRLYGDIRADSKEVSNHAA